jgi:hypothetical protein
MSTSRSFKPVMSLPCVLFSNDPKIVVRASHWPSSSDSRRYTQIGRMSGTQRSMRISSARFRGERSFGKVCNVDIRSCRDDTSVFRILVTPRDFDDSNVLKPRCSSNPAKHNLNTSPATVGGTGFGTRSIANKIISNRTFRQ